MTPSELSDAIVATIARLIAAGTVPAALSAIEAAHVERPKNRDHGDWATNVALQWGKRVGLAPRDLAQAIAAELVKVDGVAVVDTAGPGFLNITLDAASAAAVVPAILSAGDTYGSNATLQGEPINLEFVSANPTGPLHLGHTRWAALGDSIARLLRFSGAALTTEFYINDAGSQMDTFARSIYHRARGEEVPDGGYPGAYVKQLADQILAEHPDLLSLPADDALAVCKGEGYRLQLAENQATLERFRVHFDVWFSERTLHDESSGASAIERAIEHLRQQGHIFERDGAIWLRTTTFGDDKDRVLIRKDGDPTYFAADAAYYLSKKQRGFAEKIYLLGADHHGYVGRLKAIAAAAGDDPKTSLTCLIGQLVSVDGAKMSKRAGHIIELGDLMDWVGVDALRYWLARYPADSPLSLEGEKLRSRTNDNPVFYVQYAHARTVNVAKNAAAAGVTAEVFAPETLTHPTEEPLLARLVQFPELVAHAAQLREPHRIARYLETLAADYHRWYDNCRVIPLGDDPIEPVHQTRLQLNDAVEHVLRNGLKLLGVSAPDRM